MEDKEVAWNKYKKGLMIAGGMLIVALLVYLSADFAGDADKNLLKQIAEMKEDVRGLAGFCKKNRLIFFGFYVWQRQEYIVALVLLM
jgi:hypothetical protein